MSEFFKSWHRRIGLLTLAATCAFAGGWLTSRNHVDLIFLFGKGICVSTEGKFTVTSKVRLEGHRLPNLTPYKMEFDVSSFNELHKRFAIRTGSVSRIKTDSVLVPYWMAVIPLTLISTCLLRCPRCTPKEELLAGGEWPMGGFFEPWRRKMGVATLLTACLLTGVWMRSFVIEDLLHLQLVTHAYALDSSQGVLSWNSLRTNLLDFGEWLWWSKKVNPNDRNALMAELWPQWPDFLRGTTGKCWEIPYWTLVLPLALFSVSLLLKPGFHKAAAHPNPVSRRR